MIWLAAIAGVVALIGTLVWVARSAGYSSARKEVAEGKAKQGEKANAIAEDVARLTPAERDAERVRWQRD